MTIVYIVANLCCNRSLHWKSPSATCECLRIACMAFQTKLLGR